MSQQPLAATPEPPYYAVIFSSRLTGTDVRGYEETAERMLELAQQQDGYLGFESVRDDSGLGITVSYWRDTEAISRWHELTEHRAAQQTGRSTWYECFSVRVCHVQREYNFDRQD